MSTPTHPFNDLLLKYMRHVMSEEGIAFIPMMGDPDFTDDEIRSLQRVRDYIENEPSYLPPSPDAKGS